MRSRSCARCRVTRRVERKSRVATRRGAHLAETVPVEVLLIHRGRHPVDPARESHAHVAVFARARRRVSGETAHDLPLTRPFRTKIHRVGKSGTSDDGSSQFSQMMFSNE